MYFDNPKVYGDTSITDDLLQSEFMGSTFNFHSDTDLCTGQTGGPPALRLPCVQDQATRSHLHSDWLGSPPDFKKVGRDPDFIAFG